MPEATPNEDSSTIPGSGEGRERWIDPEDNSVHLFTGAEKLEYLEEKHAKENQ